MGARCQEKAQGIDCEEVTPVQKNLLFLGADGEIICKEPVTIYTCCENMGGPGGDIGNVGQPPYKRNFEVKDEDKATNQPYISKEENNLKVRIIPNPSDGVFKIEFKPLIEQELEIKILDLYGNTYLRLISETYSVDIYTKSINLKDVTNGVYFVNISGNKSNITIPIIINK